MATETFDLSNPAKPTITKDPDAKLDYTFNWTDWCNLVGDVIDTFTIIPDATVTMVTSSLDVTKKKVTVVLQGGTVKKTHRVVCRIVTLGPPVRGDDRSIFLKMKER